MSIAVAALVVLAALLWALAPFVTGATEDAAGPPADDRASDAAAERAHVLEGLRDADLDLAMGKLAPEDHAAIRTDLERRALDLLANEESAGAPRGPRPT